MRIVGGDFRGRILSSPKGQETRPTADRVRESVFNILRHASWCTAPVLEEAFVLDGFAGTGALGLEALSQGAAHAAFIEKAPAAMAVCRENIARLKLEPARAATFRCDILRPPPRGAAVAPRTLVFLDPPYGRDMGVAALAALVEKNWLAPSAVCVMEMAKADPEKNPAGFTLQDTRSYGVATLRFFIRDEI